jgi:hypothetical protein
MLSLRSSWDKLAFAFKILVDQSEKHPLAVFEFFAALLNRLSLSVPQSIRIKRRLRARA